MSRRRQFIFEGLKQAGQVSGVILLLGSLAALFVWLSLHWGATAHPNMAGDWSCGIGMVTTGFAILFLSGPVPTILTFFDITDRQLLVLSCLLIIPYWAGLGAIAGTLKFQIYEADPHLQKNLFPGQIAKRIRWQIEIIALFVAVAIFPVGPFYGSVNVGPSPGAARRMAIDRKLGQINWAKEQFARDKKILPGYVPSPTDLAPYVNGDTNFLKPANDWPIHYSLNAINQPACAKVDKDWRIRRSGWREGYTITNGTVFSIPLN